MRLRRKKNLDQRLEISQEYLVKISGNYPPNPNLPGDIDESLTPAEIFGNDNPTHLEIGCGKGQFILELAARHPEINFLAVELQPSVIVDAVKKIAEDDIKNVKFILTAAEYLARYIKPHTIGRIYLNFSTPFPKASQKNKRLTYKRYLELYKYLLVKGGEIHQKTDNMHLFEFSLEEYSKCGYLIKNISLDLHNSDFEGNIVTEYEHKFASQGMPIYRCEAVKQD